MKRCDIVLRSGEIDSRTGDAGNALGGAGGDACGGTGGYPESTAFISGDGGNGGTGGNGGDVGDPSQQDGRGGHITGMVTSGDVRIAVSTTAARIEHGSIQALTGSVQASTGNGSDQQAGVGGDASGGDSLCREGGTIGAGGNGGNGEI